MDFTKVWKAIYRKLHAEGDHSAVQHDLKFKKREARDWPMVLIGVVFLFALCAMFLGSVT